MTSAAFSVKKLDDLRLYGSWVDFFAQKPDRPNLYRRAVARYWQVFYLFYVHARKAGPLSPELKAGFAKHKKKLNGLLSAILKCPYVPAGEKLRAVLFVLSPEGCYRLAAARGALHKEKEAGE